MALASPYRAASRFAESTGHTCCSTVESQLLSQTHQSLLSGGQGLEAGFHLKASPPGQVAARSLLYTFWDPRQSDCKPSSGPDVKHRNCFGKERGKTKCSSLMDVCGSRGEGWHKRLEGLEGGDWEGLKQSGEERVK